MAILGEIYTDYNWVVSRCTQRDVIEKDHWIEVGDLGGVCFLI